MIDLNLIQNFQGMLKLYLYSGGRYFSSKKDYFQAIKHNEINLLATAITELASYVENKMLGLSKIINLHFSRYQLISFFKFSFGEKFCSAFRRITSLFHNVIQCVKQLHVSPHIFTKTTL